MSETHDPVAAMLAGDPSPPAPEVQAPEPAADAAPAAAEAPQEPAPEAPARGPDGKFVAKAETPPAATPEAAPAQPEAAPAAAATPPDGFVPIAALHDTRTKLQAAERELEALKAPKPEAAAPVAPTPQPTRQPPPSRPQIARPDAELEPEAAALWDQFQQERWNDRLEWSSQRAEEKHGVDAVKAAHEWGYQRAASDPGFSDRLRNHSDPYAFLIDEHEAEQTLAALRDPAARAKLLAILKGDAPASTAPAAATPPATPLAPPAPPSTPVTPPPRSIADATSAGGMAHVATGPGVAFDALHSKG